MRASFLHGRLSTKKSMGMTGKVSVLATSVIHHASDRKPHKPVSAPAVTCRREIRLGAANTDPVSSTVYSFVQIGRMSE